MTAAVSSANRISKLVRLLGSDRPGEVVAAAAAIGRELKSDGADWHDVADAFARRRLEPAATPIPRLTWHERAWFCRANDRGRLTPRERAFVSDLTSRPASWRGVSPAQERWLGVLYARLGGGA